ncbi:MAG: tyrosine decarboxylase MfnA [Candidatus Thermoplasmatota archaeon]|nr:tyrosine decarboxylase MfnA [Candidatus Thermoplasmatota archaeon]
MSNKRVHDAKNEILQELTRYQTQDFSFTSGHILGSMCTQPHPIAKEAYMKFLETNLGDPQLFPGTKTIEQKVLSFLLDLTHAPTTAAGHIVGGGTESNITSMWIAKVLTGKREIIIPESAHFSFQKIASLMDMKLSSIPLTTKFVMDITKVKQAITPETAAVVGIAGSTELGAIDPIPELSDLCREEHLFFHVDAAFGGFVIPFLKRLGYDVVDFDFHLPGVSSISIDAHKMGCAAIPLGALLLRKNMWLDAISVKSNCVSTEWQAGILGTRSGGPVAAAYAIIKYLGKEGYTNLVKQCMETTLYTEERIRQVGLEVMMEPTMNVIGIRLSHPRTIVEKLTKLGWKVNNLDRISSIRVVIMPHVTKPIIDKFIPDLQKVCQESGEL